MRSVYFHLLSIISLTLLQVFQQGLCWVGPSSSRRFKTAYNILNETYNPFPHTLPRLPSAYFFPRSSPTLTYRAWLVPVHKVQGIFQKACKPGYNTTLRGHIWLHHWGEDYAKNWDNVLAIIHVFWFPVMTTYWLWISAIRRVIQSFPNWPRLQL